MGKTYPLHEAKAKLSTILREVKRGREITISECGEPIAVIVPPRRRADMEARLADLERRGVLQQGEVSFGRIRPIVRKPGALQRFLETRE